MPASMLELDPIAPPLQAIVQLFSDDLGDVSFPDVDAQTLQGLAADVEERAQALSEAREAMERAQHELTASRELLYTKAERALSYAQVFAEDDERLSDKIVVVAADAKKLWGSKKKPRTKTAKPATKKAKPAKATKTANKKAVPVLTLASGDDIAAHS